jgi:glutamyl-Q tRNA(Asp) synthetase
MGKPVFRFAPSPTGELHLGSAYSALLTADMAREAGGRLLLRIEDTDPDRCRPEYEAAILDDLQWLGLEWEEPVRRQSRHFETYAVHLKRLKDMGLLYSCFASRNEIVAAARPGETDPDGAPIYPGLHKGMPEEDVARRIEAGQPMALRLDLEKAIRAAREIEPGPWTLTEIERTGAAREVEVQPARWGDTVLARKETPTSYHLSVVVDDALQGVTHVTRGQDLFASTDLHRLLQILLGLPAPLYHHHRILTDETGRKLAKSHRDKCIASLRAEGATPSDIRRMAGLESR